MQKKLTKINYYNHKLIKHTKENQPEEIQILKLDSNFKKL